MQTLCQINDSHIKIFVRRKTVTVRSCFNMIVTDGEWLQKIKHDTDVLHIFRWTGVFAPTFNLKVAGRKGRVFFRTAKATNDNFKFWTSTFETQTFFVCVQYSLILSFCFLFCTLLPFLFFTEFFRPCVHTVPYERSSYALRTFICAWTGRLYHL